MTTATRSNGVLWFAIAGGPVAWSVDALAAVAIEYDYCAHGTRASGGGGITGALVVMGLLAASVAAVAGVTGWRQLRAAGDDTGLGDTLDDRRRFMARFAVGVSMLTLFGIVLRMITALFLSPSIC
jgi:hypothetical protein